MDSDGSTAVYETKFFFRGRRIAEANEPPSDVVEVFLDFIAAGLVVPGSDSGEEGQHKYCDDNCAIETCIVIGRPYTASVKEAFEA